MERNRKWKIPHTYRSRKLKVKLWWVGGSSRKKKEGIFCTVCFVRRKFFLTFLLTSQFIVYWIHFQNIHIHTFTYQKTLLHTLLLFIFKISKSLQCILNYWELLMLNVICEVSSKYEEVSSKYLCLRRRTNIPQIFLYLPFINKIFSLIFLLRFEKTFQKQSSGGVLWKRCS